MVVISSAATPVPDLPAVTDIACVALPTLSAPTRAGTMGQARPGGAEAPSVTHAILVVEALKAASANTPLRCQWFSGQTKKGQSQYDC